ncbi:MAG: acyltransferase domain-containing protein [Bacteroidales bacterium]|nr:acyltransferase domain-containing protein [Bacteroidales bacterium]
MERKDIAIVGMSVFCPGADSIEQFWNNLKNGVDSIIEAPDNIINHFYFEKGNGNVDPIYCKKGGFTNPLKVDPLRYGILPIAAEGMDPEHLTSLLGAEQALYDAGVFDKKISLKKGSIIIGKGNFAGLITHRSNEIVRTSEQIAILIRELFPSITEEEIDQFKIAYQKQQGRYQADTAIGTMPNLVAAMVANKFDMQGPAYTVDAACASGLVAVDHSIRLLQSGQCDIVIAGGMHTAHSPMFWSVFNMMGALSRKQQIAPFSEEADGLIIGVGGGMVVLKTLEKAVADEDRIYAVIKGTAVCSDGGGSHVMVPTVQGQKRVLGLAWEAANMHPQQIGYIEAHGTATLVGDKTEITTLTEFFGDDSNPDKAFVGSVKSNIGHTMPAAGIMGLIKTALALYHRQIPPTLHCEKPLEAMFRSRFRPPQTLIDWDETKYPLIAGVNAFGFGGVNSHAVLTAYEGNKPSRQHTPEKSFNEEAIAVSAKTKELLLKKLKAGDYTNTGGDYRIVIFDPSASRMEKALSIVEKDKPWKGRMDIWFTNDPLLLNDGKIAFMFPGFDLGINSETDSISEYLDLPKIEYSSDNEMTEQSVKLFYNTIINDLALKKLGVTPDLYSGHSIGEWYAAVSAGLISKESVTRMMESLDLSNEAVEDIFFISVSRGADSLKQWFDKIPDLYLANDNCPSQSLWCGTAEAKESLIKVLKNEQIYYQELPFSSGFHTPFLKDKIGLAKESVEHIEMIDGSIPVWSATTLEPYPRNKQEYQQLVIDHMTKPVYFSDLVRKLFKEQKVRVFIQIGVGGLVSFMDDILKGQEYSAISTGISNRSGLE